MYLIVDEYPINAASARGLIGCFICGAPKRPEDILVNLGVATDEIIGLDGDVYGSKIPVMCSVCIEELGMLIGMLPAIKASQLLSANQNMAARLDAQQVEIEQWDRIKGMLAKVDVSG